MTRRSNDATPAVDRLVAPREARRLLGIGKTTEALYRRTQPDFPPCIRVGPNRVAYRQSDITAWIASRPASRPAAPTAPAPQHALEAARAAPTAE